MYRSSIHTQTVNYSYFYLDIDTLLLSVCSWNESVLYVELYLGLHLQLCYLTCKWSGLQTVGLFSAIEKLGHSLIFIQEKRCIFLSAGFCICLCVLTFCCAPTGAVWNEIWISHDSVQPRALYSSEPAHGFWAHQAPAGPRWASDLDTWLFAAFHWMHYASLHTGNN